jgi:succinate dehydrogenase / fumarate reductase membrane anchor subunit
MKSAETPLHRVTGLGASLWFAFTMLGLVGTNEVTMIQYLAEPWNALLMAAFAVISLYHMGLGLQVVIDDYVHSAGMKIFLLLLVRFVVIATSVTCLFALIRIASV